MKLLERKHSASLSTEEVNSRDSLSALVWPSQKSILLEGMEVGGMSDSKELYLGQCCKYLLYHLGLMLSLRV